MEGEFYRDDSMQKEVYHERVSVLLEALPYIQKFRGLSIVIKLGGSAMAEDSLRKEFAKNIVLLQYVGIKPIIVHGGGPQINSMLEQLSIPTEFIEGYRVTNEDSMGIVEMVLAGKINKDLTALINLAGGKAVGISGRDGNIAFADPYILERSSKDGKKEAVPLGRVGRIRPEHIDPSLLHNLENCGYVPVIAPIAFSLTDQKGPLNINADTMAAAVATSMKAEKLILLTDTPGIIVDNVTEKFIDPPRAGLLKREKKVIGGMLPKLDCCIDAVCAGTNTAHIIDGRSAHSLLLEIFTDQGIGTMIARTKPPSS